MGEAKRRGTYEDRVAQAHARMREQLRWAPAANAARRDPRWKGATKAERRQLILEAAQKLGITQ